MGHSATKAHLFLMSLHQDAWLQSSTSAALLAHILFEAKLQFWLPYSLGYGHLHGFNFTGKEKKKKQMGRTSLVSIGHMKENYTCGKK